MQHTAAAWGFRVHEDGTETLVEVEKDTFPDAPWAGVGGGGGTRLPHWARSFSKCEVSRQPSPGLCPQAGGNMRTSLEDLQAVVRERQNTCITQERTRGESEGWGTILGEEQ